MDFTTVLLIATVLGLGFYNTRIQTQLALAEAEAEGLWETCQVMAKELKKLGSKNVYLFNSEETEEAPK